MCSTDCKQAIPFLIFVMKQALPKTGSSIQYKQMLAMDVAVIMKICLR